MLTGHGRAADRGIPGECGAGAAARHHLHACRGACRRRADRRRGRLATAGPHGGAAAAARVHRGRARRAGADGRRRGAGRSAGDGGARLDVSARSGLRAQAQPDVGLPLAEPRGGAGAARRARADGLPAHDRRAARPVQLHGRNAPCLTWRTHDFAGPAQAGHRLPAAGLGERSASHLATRLRSRRSLPGHLHEPCTLGAGWSVADRAPAPRASGHGLGWAGLGWAGAGTSGPGPRRARSGPQLTAAAAPLARCPPPSRTNPAQPSPA
eukprot:scaffold30552_cov70-Phaeocystis_antarctica.AAC.3